MLFFDGRLFQAVRCHALRGASMTVFVPAAPIARGEWRTRTPATSGPDRGIAVRIAFQRTEETTQGSCVALQLSACCIESWAEGQMALSGAGSPKGPADNASRTRFVSRGMEPPWEGSQLTISGENRGLFPRTNATTVCEARAPRLAVCEPTRENCQKAGGRISQAQALAHRP